MPHTIWVKAHRLVLWAMLGPFNELPEAEPTPGGKSRQLLGMHSCNHPICLNPGHLLVGTHWENWGAKPNAKGPPSERMKTAVARTKAMITKVQLLPS